LAISDAIDQISYPLFSQLDELRINLINWS